MTPAAATAVVWRDAERAGTITRTATGSVFAYDDAFLATRPPGDVGIALRLPCTQRRFETSGVNLHPFFAGLLPEGLRLTAIARLAKASEDDLLTLLVAAGGDTIGDVAVAPEGALPADSSAEADAEALGDTTFEDLFAKSLGRLGPAGRGWAVAGVQRKVSAARISFPVRARKGAVPWILKLGSPESPRLVENEAFFMEAARRCGLVTPDVRVVHDATGASGLLVERFDRIATTRKAPLVRIHQEDACQFLDRYPADKYRLTLRDVAEGLTEFASAPIPSVAWLLRLQAFSYAIANGDLHAKNVSLRRNPASRLVEPAPAYDLVSTLPYADDRMALAMDGRDRNLTRRHFTAFGERHGVRAAATAAILGEIAEGLAPRVKELDRIGFDSKQTKHLARTIEKRLGALA